MHAVTAPGGPVVGILLNQETLLRVNGDWAPRYQRMVREARAAGAVPVFFTVDGLEVGRDRVSGRTEQDGAWTECTLPLPHVIYNRATFTHRESRQAVRDLLRPLVKQHRTVLLNSVNAITKTGVDEALRFFPETADLAPATDLWTGPVSLKLMLGRFGSVFMKAENGSHGSDVLRIGTDGSGWEVRGRVRGLRVAERPASFEQLSAFLDLVATGGPWILQQAIDLPEVDGRVFDVRVIAQKDGEGQWQVPMVLVRLALAGNVAANMSLGGEPLSPDGFRQKYGSQVPPGAALRATAADSAVQAALALEARFGALGEVGVDLGIDRQGRPWVFEANTKPLHPQYGEFHEELAALPMRYAAWLGHRLQAGRSSGLGAPATRI